MHLKEESLRTEGTRTMKIRTLSILAIFAGILLLVAPQSLSPVLAEDGFDLYECEADCRWIYGGSEWSPPPLKGASVIGYNNCILACQRKYWKQFDKDTKDQSN